MGKRQRLAISGGKATVVVVTPNGEVVPRGSGGP
jgi:hypothetical protein